MQRAPHRTHVDCGQSTSSRKKALDIELARLRLVVVSRHAGMADLACPVLSTQGDLSETRLVPQVNLCWTRPCAGGTATGTGGTGTRGGGQLLTE